MDVPQDLGYAAGWPSRPFRPIFKVKRISKRAYPPFRRFSCAIANHFLGDPNSDVKMPNFFVDVRQDLIYASGCPSPPVRPILKVKRALKRAYPSFRQFSCAITNHFLGDPDSDVKNAKFCVDVRQDLVYASGWPSWPVRPMLKVKRAPKRAHPSF